MTATASGTAPHRPKRRERRPRHPSNNTESGSNGWVRIQCKCRIRVPRKSTRRFFCDFQLHLQALVLRSKTREFHLFRRDHLRPSAIQLAGLRSLQPVAQRLRRHTQFAGHGAHALPVLDSLHGCFLELRRVHLVRYLEHSFFPSFGSSLYTTYWKAKFQGKLTCCTRRKPFFANEEQRSRLL